MFVVGRANAEQVAAVQGAGCHVLGMISRKDLVEKYDTDKDGKLSLSEFERLWLDVKRRRMVRSFQYIDEDGDAMITVEEFLKPYSETVERMDRDGDGSISRDDRRGKMRRGGRRAPVDQGDAATPEAERM